MTPLAYRIVKDMTLARNLRRFEDKAGLAKKLADAHCFDLSAVVDLIPDLSEKLLSDGSQQVLGFLPAPRTWLEFMTPSGLRMGYLLTESGPKAHVITAIDGAGVFASSSLGLWIQLGAKGGEVAKFEWANLAAFGDVEFDDEEIMTLENEAKNLLCCLALINSPRIIGRRQHMPHAGLERRLTATRGLVGKFPLHAWTDIKLEVHAPKIDSEEHEGHLTGQRALHFCRAHLRIRLGRLEFVNSHWRGDPAIGIKRARYTVVPPRGTGASA